MLLTDLLAVPGLALITFSTVTLFLLGGLAAGFSAGLLGAGGGAILVPVLVYLLPQAGVGDAELMHAAIATSLAVMVFTSAVSTFKQWSSGYLTKVPLKAWCVSVLIGAIAANFVFGLIPETALKITFVAYLLGSAVYMFLHTSEAAADGPIKDISVVTKSAAGALVGGLSTILGIGGATFTVPFLTSVSYPLKTAFAISSATGFLVSLTSLGSSLASAAHEAGGSPLTAGFVNLAAVAIIAPASMIASYAGVKANHLLPEVWLKMAYCALLVGVAADILINLL
jgi:uncharacterized membrane protein YfcA